MSQGDMVYNETYKGCLKAGCAEHQARDAAVMTLQAYKNNQFTKVTKLIEQSITAAKKLIVKRSKNAKTRK